MLQVVELQQQLEAAQEVAQRAVRDSILGEHAAGNRARTPQVWAPGSEMIVVKL